MDESRGLISEYTTVKVRKQKEETTRAGAEKFLWLKRPFCHLQLDIRGNFLTVQHWNRFLREAVQSPSLKDFNTRLNQALSYLV